MKRSSWGCLLPGISEAWVDGKICIEKKKKIVAKPWNSG